jgi:Ohr subfamily peroxiredoxin
MSAIPSISPVSKVLYTARVHTTGGRDGGVSYSDDRRLEVSHTLPGRPGTGTNPEQLFAAGWSACFEGAMGIAARKLKIPLPPDLAIDAEIDLKLAGDQYSLSGRLNVSLPGLPRADAEALANAAHQTCPYSKAIRNNVDVVIKVL